VDGTSGGNSNRTYGTYMTYMFRAHTIPIIL
jgi:hypothetical protein